MAVRGCLRIASPQSTRRVGVTHTNCYRACSRGEYIGDRSGNAWRRRRYRDFVAFSWFSASRICRLARSRWPSKALANWNADGPCRSFSMVFLMANAHGAGLMLIPALMPICLRASPTRELAASSSFPIAVVVIGVHTAAMIAMITLTALAVYKWVGLAFLRRGWVNLSPLWTVALGACGIILLAG